MAIRKQNRTIWILAAVVFLMLLTFLIRDGKFEDLAHKPNSANSSDETSSDLEDQFGDKVTSAPEKVQSENQKKFFMTLDRLAQCFHIEGSEISENAPVQIEALIQKFESTLGPVTHQADRWMTWHLHTREGGERRLRLEITESDEGKIGRELHYFNVDREGQPSPIEIESEKANNPSDEIISQMLKEGEVFYKERAAVAFFANNQRVEYLEKDGELAEIEVFKDDHQFRCTNVNMPENCQCL